MKISPANDVNNVFYEVKIWFDPIKFIDINIQRTRPIGTLISLLQLPVR